MKFTLNKGRSLIAVFIVLAVYNVVAFAIPFSREGSFWISYGFSLFSILLTAGVGLYALGHETLKSKFYGFPLIFVAWVYLVVQVVLGLIFMAFVSIPFWLVLTVNVILAGACLLGLIGVSIGKAEIERIDVSVKEKVFYMKSVQADIETLETKATEVSLKKALKDLAETIRYSDPMSNEQLVSIENKIETKIAALCEGMETGNADMAKALCGEVQQLFAERNKKCRLLK